MSTATAAITDYEIATTLADARWLIINFGWRQHVVGNVKEGFSVDGAILAASVRDDATPAPGEHRKLHMAARVMFMRVIGQFEPGPWNDVAGRTRDEVLDALLSAERLARKGDLS